MQLHTLPSVRSTGKRRLGQGHGSGRGKTGGRGTKGQKARNKIPIHFEGGAITLIKRLPFRRGKGRNRSYKNKPVVVNIKVLNLFPAQSTIDLVSLVEKKIVVKDEAMYYGVKILGDGELTVPLHVVLPTSLKAAKKIEKAGGSVGERPATIEKVQKKTREKKAK